MNVAQPTKIYMVRILDARGWLEGFRMFSSREKAEQHTHQLPFGQKFVIVEREATPQSVAPLVRAGH